MSKYRIAINGYGRIGRCILRALYELGYSDRIEVAAINDIADSASMVYLTNYDSVHGRFIDASLEGDYLKVKNDSILLIHESDISSLPWKSLGIDLVLECTGLCRTRKDAEAHLAAGAGKVLLSYPGPGDVDITVVYAVNHKNIKKNDAVVSNASCTSNCIVPVLKVMDDAFGVSGGMITSIHSAMNDQHVLDSYMQSDPRKMRSAINSIIPVETHLAAGIARIMPELTNKFGAISVRVPTTDVSAMDISLVLKKETDAVSVNRVLKEASEGIYSGIIGFSGEPLVSYDFRHDPRSSVVDAMETRASGNMAKLLCWFDNEWAYAVRMCDTSLVMMNLN